MTKNELLAAIGEIDDRIIEEASPYKAKEVTIPNTLKRRNTMTKFLALAACFCLIVGGLFFAFGDEIFDGKDSAQTPDRSYAVWFNGYLYEPISHHYHEVYPELSDIYEKIVTGYKYNIKKEHIGEYLGVFPALKDVHPEGKAYRFSLYPDYDSIIIVEREGKYSFYVADGGILPEGSPTDSTTTLYYYGQPTSFVFFYPDESYKTITGEELNTIMSLLSGKELTDYNKIEEKVFNEWYAEKGDVGVSFDGEELSYDSAEIHAEFTAFMTEGNRLIWINTDKGFKNLALYYNSKFGYFNFMAKSYELTESEAKMLKEIIES